MPFYDWSVVGDVEQHLDVVTHVAEKAREAWPEVLGGGAAYFVHNLCHGLYHRIGRVMLRVIGRSGH